MGVSSSDAGTQPVAQLSPTQTAGMTCTTEGAQSCEGHASRTPLVCEKGAWHARPQCEANERCDSAPGSGIGRCRAIAQECMNRTPGEAFCDANGARLVCDDLVSSRMLPCGPLQHCIGTGDRVRCACKPGTIEDAEGCVAGTHCEIMNGGCDTLTKCVDNGIRTCSPCPEGYKGTGDSGCIPQASALEVAGTTLAPAFAPEIREYESSLPFLTANAMLKVSGPSDATLEINGAAAPLGVATAVPVKRGDNSIEIVLKTRFGVNSTYHIKLKRRSLSETDLLKADRASLTDIFGYSVALAGDTLAIGAVLDDAGGALDSGAVYMFGRDGAHWVQKQMLTADKPLSQECFGAMVALSADTLAVGALYDRPCAPSSPSHGGSVYIFKREADKWVPAGHVTGPNGGAPNDGFGSSVALDGDMLAVGAMFADGAGRDAGAVHVFKRGADGYAFQQTLLASPAAAGALFGTVVALQADTLVASAYAESSQNLTETGAVYVFKRDGQGPWQPPLRLQPRAAEARASFGYSLALWNSRLAVGAPHYAALTPDTPRGQVVLFERDASGQWKEDVTLQATNARTHDQFGMSVGLNAQYLAVGAIGDSSSARGVDGDQTSTQASDAGAVHVFSKSAQGEWQAQSFIKASNAESGDAFGCAIAGSERELVVSANQESSSSSSRPEDNSAPSSGAVYVYGDGPAQMITSAH